MQNKHHARGTRTHPAEASIAASDEPAVLRGLLNDSMMRKGRIFGASTLVLQPLHTVLSRAALKSGKDHLSNDNET